MIFFSMIQLNIGDQGHHPPQVQAGDTELKVVIEDQ